MIRKATSALLLMASCAINAHAIVPSGGWTLQDETPLSKDFAMRIDVDPGEKSGSFFDIPSNAFWGEEIIFKEARGGHLGLSRENGEKFATIGIWGALEAKPASLLFTHCDDTDQCIGLSGSYDWRVGHNYRFRVEKSPRTTSDDTGVWWQVTLADLSSGTISLLGEIKTVKTDGIERFSNAFLQYPEVSGATEDCTAHRHTLATLGQTRGAWGVAGALDSSNGMSYGKPDVCNLTTRLPGMTPKDYSSASWEENDAVTLLGNNFMGIHQWGDFGKQAKKGMLFVKDLSEEEPYIFEALGDGEYDIFPREGRDNGQWKSLGKGYPIMNDLFSRQQRLREWSERNDDETSIGDYFIYHNPYFDETEYFRLTKKDAGEFPIDKSDNDHWHYVGRYPKKNDALSSRLTVHFQDENDRKGKKGWLYFDMSSDGFYILRKDGAYGAFPEIAGDNEWWQYIGHHS
ncbi:hypothetical protein N5W20_06965 [Candidatus Kirkpatrickella diaphorinae]|uniref:Uncharacterized protein n=1 Tax=Candidatus Kirkpatrickella diaphorinae TaxID=2984322 RepID=A0ABY6GH55_9PROT|nr:hypothetical protein [Candidatus Kirkpatrickella diaphorinae]UYH50846.1 hypothetical protein N5W20_06965 [Candidatus Kirkpatrickella diaphorinae]